MGSACEKNGPSNRNAHMFFLPPTSTEYFLSVVPILLMIVQNTIVYSLLILWIASLVRADDPCSEKGCFTRETIQVWKTFIANRLFNGRRLYERMEACFDKHVVDGIDMMTVSDTFWSKMVAFGAQGGVTEDSWPGFVGFLEDNPTPLVSEQNLKNFPSYPLESVNITVLEPCNTVSNWAFHQAMVEVCESTEWFSEEEWLTGLIRAFHFMGPGSTFMHASGTSVGREADNESIRQLAWWYLQYGLQELPYDPIIHDLSEEPAPRTALEVIQDLNEMILNEPATSWDQTIRAYYTLP